MKRNSFLVRHLTLSISLSESEQELRKIYRNRNEFIINIIVITSEHTLLNLCLSKLNMNYIYNQMKSYILLLMAIISGHRCLKFGRTEFAPAAGGRGRCTM